MRHAQSWTKITIKWFFTFLLFLSTVAVVFNFQSPKITNAECPEVPAGANLSFYYTKDGILQSYQGNYGGTNIEDTVYIDSGTKLEGISASGYGIQALPSWDVSYPNNKVGVFDGNGFLMGGSNIPGQPNGNSPQYDSDPIYSTQYASVTGYQGCNGNDARVRVIIEIQTPTPTPPPPILGCTNSNATNYNPSATQDDGSCTYLARIDLTKYQSTFAYPTNSDGFGVMNVQLKSPSSLTWSGNANVAWINTLTGNAAGGSGLTSGLTIAASFTVNPAQALIGVNNGTITESCNPLSGCDSSYQSRTLGVQYTVPGPVVTISAYPPGPVVLGTPVTLTWTGTNCNATSPVSSSNFGAANTCSGSKVVTPVFPSSTYTITIQGLSDVDATSGCTTGNFCTASVTVNVTLPDTPVVTIQGRTGANAYSSGPISITSGSNVDLKWTVSHETATSCTASNGWSGGKAFATGDNFATPGKANVIAGTTFTIICSNAGGNSVPASFEVRILTVNLSASPSSGNAPLNNVSLTATPSGTVSGPTYRYFFDCTNDGINELDTGNIASNPYTATNLCSYSSAGTYTAKVTVWHDQAIATNTANVTVSVPPNSAPTTNNVTVTTAYCVTGPGTAVINWDYSDPNDNPVGTDPQSAFQVQADLQGSSFNPPAYDSGKITGSQHSYTATTLPLNKTLKVRVMVWDTRGPLASGWTVSGSWKSAQNAFPGTNFCWPENCNAPAPGLKPKANSPIQFTDLTTFSDGQPDSRHAWSWTFGDGGTSTQKNPAHTYGNSNVSYNVTLTATDDNNQSCTVSKLINVQRSIPIWREISPGQ